MSISNFPNGFANGLTLRGVPVESTNPGKSFFVNNSSVLADGGIGGSNSNKGTYQQPFKTIDYAIGRCTAGRGDVIYVMPGHVEDVSTAAAGAATVDLDVDGVTIIGLGRGAAQPRFDFTATAGIVTVSADNCAIVNMNFHANVSAVVIGLSVLAGATDLLVKNCSFDVETTTTDEFLISVNIGVGCTYTTVEDSTFDMGLGGAAAGIKLVGASDHVQVKGCHMQGDHSLALISGITTLSGDHSLALISGITTLSTNVLIEDNLLIQGSTLGLNAVAVIVLLTGTSGIIRNNSIICDVATFALQTVADTCSFLNNDRTDDIAQAKTSAQISTSVTASADS
jgi:hypothetical protein